RERVHPDEPELPLPRLEGQLHVAHEHRARAVEDAGLDPEHPLHRRDELRRGVDDRLHAAASLSGAGSNPSARSSACPTRNSVFSENCGPISWRPTGRPSERPHGIEIPGMPAMLDGIVSTSARYMANGFSVFSPRRNATVGDVGLTSTSKRSNSASC